jgi:hypothetical protein
MPVTFGLLLRYSIQEGAFRKEHSGRSIQEGAFTKGAFTS